MKNEKKFCVYLVTYLGNDMPPFYIGSSSVRNIERGYRGSVASKEFKGKWKNAPDDMFKIAIVSLHETRNEAQTKESELQRHLRVLEKPSIYVNRNIAGKEFSPVYGPRPERGLAISKGKLGKKHRRHRFRSKEHRAKIAKNRTGTHLSRETKSKISDTLKGRPLSPDTIEKMRVAKTGKKFTEEHRLNMSGAQSGRRFTEEHRARLSEAAKNRRK